MSTKPAWAPNRGDMIWIDFTPRAGKEMAGRHPFLVLSPKTFNRKMGSVMGVAMTGKEHRENPFQLKNFNARKEPSFFNTNQVSTFDWRARAASPHPWGKISDAALREILDYINSILALCED